MNNSKGHAIVWPYNSKFNNLLHLIAFEIRFQNNLNITIIGGRGYAFMYSRKTKTHIIDIKISPACEFPINDLNCTSFFCVAPFINYEKVPSCETEFLDGFYSP